MVYKRFVKKRVDGKLKTFGPYYYESYRDKDGNTKTRYVSAPKKISAVTRKRFVGKTKLFLIFGLIAIFLVAGLIFMNFSFTGKTLLNVKDISPSNKILRGDMKVILEENEFLPAYAKVLINNSGEEHIYDLKDLVKEDSSYGFYYISGKNISGEGEGYGASDSVSFVLDIYNKKTEDEKSGGVLDSENETEIPAVQPEENITEENETSGEEIITEENETSEEIPAESETPTEEVPPSEAPATQPEETPAENEEQEVSSSSSAEDNSAKEEDKEEKKEEKENKKEEKSSEESSGDSSEASDGSSDSDSSDSGSSKSSSSPESSEESSATGAVVKNIFRFLSGMFLSITGKASVELAEEISGSVSSGEDFAYNLSEGQTASIKEGSVSTGDDKDVNLKIKDNVAVVSLDSGGENEITIDFGKLNLPAKEGELKISLIYENETLVEDSTIINLVNATDLNETLAENETIIENISGLQFIMNFTDINLNINEVASLDLENYFSGASGYSADAVGNISVLIDGKTAQIIPDGNFSGSGKAKFTAYFEKESIEGNEFFIYVFNFTKINMSRTNVTIVTLLKKKIRVGEPAKWVKNITLVSENVGQLDVELPFQSENISVKRIETSNVEDEVAFTGNIVAKTNAEIEYSENKFFGWIKKLFNLRRVVNGITGAVVDGEIPSGSVVITLDSVSTGEYSVEYETPAPKSYEENITNGKRIIISALDELNYTNVTAFSEISGGAGNNPEGLQDMKLIWKASREDAIAYGYFNEAPLENAVVLINGKEVPYDVYLKKKRIDELKMEMER